MYVVMVSGFSVSIGTCLVFDICSYFPYFVTVHHVKINRGLLELPRAQQRRRQKQSVKERQGIQAAELYAALMKNHVEQEDCLSFMQVLSHF